MVWEITATAQVRDWYRDLPTNQQDQIVAALEVLAEDGPDLGRPLVDRVQRSEYHNMKELRPRGAAKTVRILFVFDPTRRAVLLLGGDKAQNWTKWYQTAIPEADRLYADYLEELGGTGGDTTGRR